MPDDNGSPLYTAAQVREFDRIAIEEQGIPGSRLMGRAGEALAACIARNWPQARKVVVVCGPGNNGGDGYVLARLLLETQRDVRVVALAEPRGGGDAATARDAWLAAGGRIEVFSGVLPGDVDLFVDALLGSGLDRPPEGDYRAVIETLNRRDVPVLAADIPSGVHADSGCVAAAAVCADVTLTFIGRKRGLFTGEAVDYTGRVEFAGLDVPATVYRDHPADVELLVEPPLAALARPRRRSAHKGAFGHVLVVGGNHGMSGAARLAAEAAAHIGAGLVSVATRAAHAPLLNAGRAELMVHGVETPADLAPLLARASQVVVGPGLGGDAWARALLETVLDSALPLVVDADALNLLARDPLPRGNWILTPHPGEAGRLLDSSARRVQADRFAAVPELLARYGGVVVLKGAGSLIGTPGLALRLCPRGNPGMASAGMGDVLSGVIGALIGQGLSQFDAASAGVCLHAAAGDRLAAQHGERGMLAGDLMPLLRDLVNGRV
jgi:NAD(P)H-hydrate epimerase